MLYVAMDQLGPSNSELDVSLLISLFEEVINDLSNEITIKMNGDFYQFLKHDFNSHIIHTSDSRR